MSEPWFTFPQIDPIIVEIGPLALRWYGMMYLLGFLAALWLLNRHADKPGSGWTRDQVSDLLFYCFVGVILGGRLGYVLFYGWQWLLQDPLYLFKITDGGMSFHGGLLGVIIAMLYQARKMGRSFWQVSDLVAPTIPVGLGLGRIGNFINAELWGRTTDAPWGIVFPGAGPLPRHPSQLYEAFLEGLVLFIALWWLSKRSKKPGAVSGLFLVGYGLSRFLVEFVREPDAHMGIYLGMTMGQVLCVPMLAFGLYLMLRPTKQEKSA
ncbi:prolipoprotein diacylglyceryl transferase [Ferrimonas marina]|uniref:Phosphatidylglycerol--prolipoprotein diacylglyceryl transferase n=1 Tax=Ferrimonas marina TaxID=299255 RepID=A0A1M5ZG86_9GAMM|nr:prolipoprotein diacylglyceryl transferase [Ferrimonas marina]SHI23220.1 phosphatidylglycerol:prolipoprotein diacylglycerol transferase [Ferrimonas marina]